MDYGHIALYMQIYLFYSMANWGSNKQLSWAEKLLQRYMYLVLEPVKVQVQEQERGLVQELEQELVKVLGMVLLNMSLADPYTYCNLPPPEHCKLSAS